MPQISARAGQRARVDVGMATWIETCPKCGSERTVDNNDGSKILLVDCLECGKLYPPKNDQGQFHVVIENGEVKEFRVVDPRDIQ